MECSRNITNLPVEILDLLFKYCGDMTNKLHLAQTHPYLVEAFAYHCRNLFECISNDKEISLSSWRFILPVCGSNIKTIHKNIRDSSDEELVNLVALHCSKLEKIKLSFETDSVDCVKSLICQRQNSLKAIRLILMLRSESRELNTKMLHEFPELPLLEELKITNIPIENYDHIQKFKNLVKLEIGCWGLTKHVIDVFALCAPLKKLQILFLRGVRIIASEQTKIHLPVLQLKKLSITCEQHNSHAEVQRFILSQGKSLESLRYDCELVSYSNEDFLEVIRICRSLRICMLPVQDFIFDLECVEEILVILRQNGVTEDNPFLLVPLDLFDRYEEVVELLKCSSSPELIIPCILSLLDN
ncbi:uncharacterized protein [Drosophila kikkawai]|uniref:Uncharacterized protein n=1 Tax=Drosophila kikkawai TaxID=30033 RepID=A0A6P4IR18_DROKI|nr:uncharacterized protein LOC108080612 [Drosophila kikkawai]